MGLELVERLSTDSDGLASCLGLKAEAGVGLETVMKIIQKKIGRSTKLKLRD